MLLRLIAAVACVIVLVALSATAFLNNGVQKRANVPWMERNSLKEIARRSKEEGRTKVTVPAPWVNDPGMSTKVDEALQNYSVVVAEMIASKSYVFDAYSIQTWYKFRITDTLSKTDAEHCPTCPDVPEPPKDFTPISADEFLFATGGGTVDIDGVEVTMNDRSLPVFESGKKYLLVISLTRTGVALLGAGPAGVFQVADDDKLEAVNRRNYALQAEIRDRFNGKLSELKSHAKLHSLKTRAEH